MKLLSSNNTFWLISTTKIYISYLLKNTFLRKLIWLTLGINDMQNQYHAFLPPSLPITLVLKVNQSNQDHKIWCKKAPSKSNVYLGQVQQLRCTTENLPWCDVQKYLYCFHVKPLWLLFLNHYIVFNHFISLFYEGI